MNCFEKLTEDIFRVPEFVDFFTVEVNNGSSSSALQDVQCIQYHTDNDLQFTEYGYDDGVEFVIVVKCADFEPKKNQKITFHDKQYKIVRWETDGFNLMNNITIKSVTSK